MKKLQKLYLEYKDDRWFYKNMMNENISPFVIYLIRSYVPKIACKVFGHKWESDDYGDSESGGIGVHCTRCGESHFQRLY